MSSSSRSSPPSPCWLEESMKEALDQRIRKGTLRKLPDLEQMKEKANADNTGRSIIDFSSNDYLGLARNPQQQKLVHERYEQLLGSWKDDNSERSDQHNKLLKSFERPQVPTLGSTGSRLLSGNSMYASQLEVWLAKVHNRPSALIFNSGYDANLSVLSCIPCTHFVFDEYSHNSLIMGMRLNMINSIKAQNRVIHSVTFQHNSVEDLQKQLTKIVSSTVSPKILVIVESVYSMDGDIAPLHEMLDLAEQYKARVIVDEAHGLGVFGRKIMINSNHISKDYLTHNQEYNTEELLLGNHQTFDYVPTVVGGTGVLAQLELENHPALACSIYTFGKAAGCHGAVACLSNKRHKEYLWNYAWPFIYSTSLPLHSLVCIQCSYLSMISLSLSSSTNTAIMKSNSCSSGEQIRRNLHSLISLFHQLVRNKIIPYSGKRIQLLALEFAEQNSSSPSSPSSRSLALQCPIQALLILPPATPNVEEQNEYDGNGICSRFCSLVYSKSNRRILLYPIKSPTVPKGKERIRIIIHAHNKIDEIYYLVHCMKDTLIDMGILINTREITPIRDYGNKLNSKL